MQFSCFVLFLYGFFFISSSLAKWIRRLIEQNKFLINNHMLNTAPWNAKEALLVKLIALTDPEKPTKNGMLCWILPRPTAIEEEVWSRSVRSQRFSLALDLARINSSTTRQIAPNITTLIRISFLRIPNSCSFSFLSRQSAREPQSSAMSRWESWSSSGTIKKFKSNH